MAATLQLFYHGEERKWNREMEIFRTCNDKIGKILRWTNKDENSVEELRQLGLSRGGLYNASMRRRAWPVLCASQDIDLTSRCEVLLMADLDIIRKDIQRSAMFRSKSVTGSIVKGEQQSESLQNKLTSVLVGAISASVKEKAEKPCYYQGLHDVAFVLLQNLDYDESATTKVLRRLMKTHLRDAARKDFSNVTFILDSFLMPLIYNLDIELYQALVESDIPLSSAVLPWLITLFAHSVQDGAVASRLMDAFMANAHPMLPFYVTVALLLHPTFRQQLLASAFDTAMMHMSIQGLPGQLKNDLAAGEGDEAFVTAQDVIDFALKIMEQNPPESLLRLVGFGLKKRTRRRLKRKALSIPMLQMSAQTWSCKALAEKVAQTHFLPVKGVATNFKRSLPTAKKVYNTVVDKCQAAVAGTKQALMPLQVFLLFVLMPRQYVQQFYCLLQFFSGLLTPSWSTKSEYGSHEKVVSGFGEMTPTTPGYEEDTEVPGIVKSDSSWSIDDLNHEKMPSMDKSNSTWSIRDLDDDLIYETDGEIFYDCAFIV